MRYLHFFSIWTLPSYRPVCFLYILFWNFNLQWTCCIVWTTKWTLTFWTLNRRLMMCEWTWSLVSCCQRVSIRRMRMVSVKIEIYGKYINWNFTDRKENSLIINKVTRIKGSKKSLLKMKIAVWHWYSAPIKERKQQTRSNVSLKTAICFANVLWGWKWTLRVCYDCRTPI